MADKTEKAIINGTTVAEAISLMYADLGGSVYAPGVRAVGGGASVQVALTVTNGAYSIADVAGGLITFANAVRAAGKHSVIYSVKLFGVAALEYDLWLFNADIATPAADNAAFALAAGDGTKFLGSIPIISTDYAAAQSAFNAATKRAVALKVKAAAAATSIYGYLVARATTTPGTTALVLTVDFEYMD